MESKFKFMMIVLVESLLLYLVVASIGSFATMENKFNVMEWDSAARMFLSVAIVFFAGLSYHKHKHN